MIGMTFCYNLKKIRTRNLNYDGQEKMANKIQDGGLQFKMVEFSQPAGRAIRRIRNQHYSNYKSTKFQLFSPNV
jgi:hypothetical protein